MSEEKDFNTAVAQARKLSAMFGAALTVADKLGELGSLHQAVAETQQQLTQLQEAAATLRAENADKHQHLVERIEGGLRAQYQKQEEMLAQRHSLANEVMQITGDLAERRKQLNDVERRIGIAEGKYADIQAKIGMLRGSLSAA